MHQGADTFEDRFVDPAFQGEELRVRKSGGGIGALAQFSGMGSPWSYGPGEQVSCGGSIRHPSFGLVILDWL